MRRYAVGGSVLLALGLFGLSPSVAWWTDGHQLLTKAAVYSLPDELPAFFTGSAEAIAQYSVDPDLLKEHPGEAPNARSSETPNHFLDFEAVSRFNFEESSYEEYVRYVGARNLKLVEVGALPYAIADHAERLAVAFAEHRKWPTMASIRERCFFYAGFLAHYAQDLMQPLHTTVHHDGRVTAGGKSPHSGIHAKVDALIAKTGFDPAAATGKIKTEAMRKELIPWVMSELLQTRKLVDRVYELEPSLRAKNGAAKRLDPAVLSFAKERAEAARVFTARLYLWAWLKSAEIRLPEWHRR